MAKDLDPSDDDGDVLSPSALDPQTHAEFSFCIASRPKPSGL